MRINYSAVSVSKFHSSLVLKLLHWMEINCSTYFNRFLLPSLIPLFALIKSPCNKTFHWPWLKVFRSAVNKKMGECPTIWQVEKSWKCWHLIDPIMPANLALISFQFCLLAERKRKEWNNNKKYGKKVCASHGVYLILKCHNSSELRGKEN